MISSRPVHVAAALVAILLVGAWLRCQRLSDVSYWFDEAFSIRMAEFSFAEIWTHAALDTSPPLYYWLLKAWGIAVGTSPSALRGLSVLLGLVTVAGTFLLVREAYHRGPSVSQNGMKSALPALLAASLVALSPPHVYFSSQVRMYSLATALAVLSSWMLMRALRREPPRRRDWIVYTFLAVLLVYTHPFGLVAVAAQYLFAIGYLWFHPAIRSRNASRWRLAPAVVSAFCVQAIWQFWLPATLNQQYRVRGGYWSRSVSLVDIDSTILELLYAPDWTMSVGFHDVSPAWTGVAASLLATVVIAALLLLQSGRNAADLYIGLAAAVPVGMAIVASSAGLDLFIARYLLIAHVFILIGIAVVICRARPRWLRVSLCLVAIGLVGLQARGRYSTWEKYAAYAGMPVAAGKLAELRSEAEPVLVCSPLLFPIVCAYADRRDGIHTIGSRNDYPFYWGTAVMTDEDFLSHAQLSDAASDSIWTLDSRRWRRWWSPFEVRVPPDWREATTIVIPEHYCELVLRRYERVRAGQEATGSGSVAEDADSLGEVP